MHRDVAAVAGCLVLDALELFPGGGVLGDTGGRRGLHAGGARRQVLTQHPVEQCFAAIDHRRGGGIGHRDDHRGMGEDAAALRRRQLHGLPRQRRLDPVERREPGIGKGRVGREQGAKVGVPLVEHVLEQLVDRGQHRRPHVRVELGKRRRVLLHAEQAAQPEPLR